MSAQAGKKCEAVTYLSGALMLFTPNHPVYCSLMSLLVSRFLRTSATVSTGVFKGTQGCRAMAALFCGRHKRRAGELLKMLSPSNVELHAQSASMQKCTWHARCSIAPPVLLVDWMAPAPASSHLLAPPARCCDYKAALLLTIIKARAGLGVANRPRSALAAKFTKGSAIKSRRQGCLL